MKNISFLQKRITGILLLLLVNIIFLPSYLTTAMTEEQGIMDAFDRSGASMENVNINGHGTLSDLFISPEDGFKMTLSIMDELGMKDYTIEDNSIENNTVIHGTIQRDDGANYHLIVQSVHTEDFNETNVVIDVELWEKTLDFNDVQNNINKVLDKYGNIAYTTCITGTYDGSITIDEADTIVNGVMETMDAEEVELMKDEKLISVVGYSDKIKDWISYGGNKVNINVAMRYNSYENKTYIWIATPLIAIGY